MCALIIAPFWRTSGHVGIYRIDRFVRWLNLVGTKVILVRAGSSDSVTAASWGTEISVADPLRLYPDYSPNSAPAPSGRNPNQWRRLLAYAVFCPDLSVLWAKRAARHPMVLKHAKVASFVLSSSPPESSHLAAGILAHNFSIPLIVDMRDGWLDEPLKPLLRASRFQAWREGRLEKAILRQATGIFVTSTVWNKMLEERLPFTRGKVSVLTNGYPNSVPQSPVRTRKEPGQPLLLVHTGRFTGSSLSRRPDLLLGPIHEAIDRETQKGEILLIGGMENNDLPDINGWKKPFAAKNWTLIAKPPISREQVLHILSQADGLLLLSASQAAIPSKLFEYIAAEKPILAATLHGSALWQISKKAPQLIPFDYTGTPTAAQVVKRFLHLTINKEITPRIPCEFSEPFLSRIFLDRLRSLGVSRSRE